MLDSKMNGRFINIHVYIYIIHTHTYTPQQKLKEELICRIFFISCNEREIYNEIILREHSNDAPA